MQWIVWFVLLVLIHGIMIYPVDNVIQQLGPGEFLGNLAVETGRGLF